MNHHLSITVSFLLACGCHSTADIERAVFSSGGSILTSAGTDVATTIGEPITGRASSGSGAVNAGFWAGLPFPGDACVADLAPPVGVLDLSDINAFVSGFLAGDLVADLDGNGLFDLQDISAFVGSFLDGCP